MSDAYLEGYNAYNNGVEAFRCPYVFLSNDLYRWRAGWWAAEEEANAEDDEGAEAIETAVETTFEDGHDAFLSAQARRCK